jgi:Putative zinc-finger
MSETFQCDDKNQLVAYLYDELDGITRRRIDEHLRVCTACAEEVDALTGVRRELAGWAPPNATLGFTLIQSPTTPVPAEVVRPTRWWPPAVPVWAQAAAAVLVVGAGLSVANLQIRYGADGLVITTGWMASGGAVAVSAPPATRPVVEPDWQPALAALESSLRQEIREARAAESAVQAAATLSRGASLSAERVAALIEQSERRQQQELALRLAQFGRDLEVQRRSDLVRINQGFGQFEGRAGAEIARQRQMLDYIMRVSAQPPPQ